MFANMEAVQAKDTYEGVDNPITMSSVYQEDFICSFDAIKRYPFDKQICSVTLFIHDAETDFVHLSPQTIIDNGPADVGQYQVKGWVFEKITINNENGLMFSVQLQRNILRIFFITYMPTILMNLINQATNYIDNHFDLLLTINITCMMVLASVYVSVSNNLPLTAEIKYVEIWLLFNLAYPVLVVLSENFSLTSFSR